MTEDAAKSYAKRRLAMVVAGTLAGVVIGLGAVYGISTLLGNRAGDPSCRPAVETAGRVAPFARGEVAALAPATAPLKLPDLAFRDGTGSERHPADPRGRTRLLNPCAPWGVPPPQQMHA